MNPSDIRSAQFIDTFFPLVDGGVNTVDNYARIMNRNSYSCVVCPKTSQTSDEELPYDVYRTKATKIAVTEYPVGTPRLDQQLKEFLLSKKLDILHAHTPFPEGNYAVYLGRKAGIPVVSTFHSKYYDDVLNVTGSKSLAKVFVDKIVSFYNKCDDVWTCSRGTAETLRSYGYKGDIFVIDNGSSMIKPDIPDDELKLMAQKKIGMDPEKKNILFVGHFILHKNIKLILDTFKLLSLESDEYRLYLCGDGYDEKEVLRHAKSLDFPEGVVNFPGRINDRDLLAGIYLNCDLFFFPSVYDNAPLVVREAAAMMTPSLLTKGSNAAEAVIDNVSGDVAEEDPESMKKRIVEIFSDMDRHRLVSKNAKAMIPKTWESIVDIALAKYAEIIERYRFKNK